MSDVKSDGLAPALVFGSLCFVWGSTWLAIKVGLASLPPFTFAGLRFLVAWALFLVYMLARRIRFPKDRVAWKVMIFLGLTQIAVPYALVFWGEQYVTAGLTAILFATLPFFVAAFAHFMVPGERLTACKIVGMIVSFTGVAIIFSQDLILTFNSLLGGAAVLASSGIAGLANVVGKKYSEYINTTVNVVVQTGIGALLLLAGGILVERGLPLTFGPESVFAILYLAAAGSAYGFLALYWLFTRMEVTRISLFTFITPIVAVGLGWLLLGEGVAPAIGVGGALILVGVVFVNRAPKTR
jgi:drug/metabolite transporter (DMT)-like permease